MKMRLLAAKLDDLRPNNSCDNSRQQDAVVQTEPDTAPDKDARHIHTRTSLYFSARTFPRLRREQHLHRSGPNTRTAEAPSCRMYSQKKTVSCDVKFLNTTAVSSESETTSLPPHQQGD